MGHPIADRISDDEAEAISKYIAEHGVTRFGYMVSTPVWESKRLKGLTWGKGVEGKPQRPKKVQPIKRSLKP